MSEVADTTLALPRLLRTIDTRRPIGVISGDPASILAEARKQIDILREAIDLAEKFVFDSGLMMDAETANAFSDTTIEMISAGLFHLPSAACWIEDAFAPEHNLLFERYGYLCLEASDAIIVSVFVRTQTPGFSEWSWVDGCGTISLTERSDRDTFMFTTMASGPDSVEKLPQAIVAQAVGALKRFIVTLATPQAVRERVGGRDQPRQWRGPKLRRFDYTVVRVPQYIPQDGEDGQGMGSPRRCHLVRGYVWGRHTRPVEEQRWIAPFFRGNASLGMATRSHYVVKG
jgi:hypothetical protein